MRKRTLWERTLAALIPTEDGGPPPALDAGRALLRTLLAIAFGLVVGAAAGFALVLAVWAAPDFPPLAIGFVVGTLLGAAVALVLCSRAPWMRRAGGIAVLATPLLVLLAPFALLAGGLWLLFRWPRGQSKGSR